MTFKRLEYKPDEITLGLMLAAIVSMFIILFCLHQMNGHGHVKLGWFIYFVIANIVYVVKYTEPDPMNALVIASGPLAFFFWTVVGVWNKFVSLNKKTHSAISSKSHNETSQKYRTCETATQFNSYIVSKPEPAKSVPVNPTSVKPAPIEPVNVTIKSPTDLLNELNDKVTEKLKKYDVFDIEVPTRFLKMFLKILKTRHLEWNDLGYEFNGKGTIVVGKKGVDFGQHEKRR